MKEHALMAMMLLSATVIADTRVNLSTSCLSLQFAADGRPASLVRLADGRELLNTADPGAGFEVMAFDFETLRQAGERLDELSFDGTHLVARHDSMACTFRVAVHERYLAFTLERVEGIPRSSLQWLRFRMNTTGPVGLHPLDPMTFNSARNPGRTDDRDGGGPREVNWRWLWARNATNPLGGFALQCPRDDSDYDETLLHVWVNETLPHPAIKEAWTVEQARAWLTAWQAKFAEVRRLTIEGTAQQDLYRLVDLAARENITRIKLHTNTWRGEYWPYTRHMLHVNPNLFPGGEPDFKRFCDFVHSKGMGVDIHTISMAISNMDPDYVHGADGPDPRLASWVRGTLAQPASADDQTLYFRPGAGEEYPSRMRRITDGPSHVPFYLHIDTMRIEKELIRVGAFTDTDRPVWVLKSCQRGLFETPVSNHEEETEAVGLLRPYGQALTAGSDTTLLDEVAGKYAAFCNRNGIEHIELDGLEIHRDKHYGAAKFAQALYRALDHPVTSNTSNGAPMPFHIEYWFTSSRGLGGKSAKMPLMLEESGRRATNPYEVHTDIARVAAEGGNIGGISKPQPMFSLSVEALDTHGLSKRFLDQLRLWRLAAKHMDDGQREEILRHYAPIQSFLGQAGNHNETHVVYDIETRGNDLILTPFSLLERPGVDIAWGQGQEFGPIVPWQFVPVGETVTVSNRFASQEPHFIIQTLPVFNQNGDAPKSNPAGTAVDRDMEGYDAGAGLAPGVSAGGTRDLFLQPGVNEIEDAGDHTFADSEGSLAISIDNLRNTPLVHEDDLPHWSVNALAQGARGLGLTVDSDGSGAVLVIQLRGRGTRDYVVPLDFNGRRDIVIPNGTASWADARWGWRMGTGRVNHAHPFGEVRIGFGYVPPRTHAEVTVSKLRLLSEHPGALVDPVLSVGQGQVKIVGRVPTDRYLWFTGGDSIGVYDLNWNELERLPVQKQNFMVPSGLTRYQVETDALSPQPCLAVQLLTFGEPMPIAERSL